MHDLLFVQSNDTACIYVNVNKITGEYKNRNYHLTIRNIFQFNSNNNEQASECRTQFDLIESKIKRKIDGIECVCA